MAKDRQIPYIRTMLGVRVPKMRLFEAKGPPLPKKESKRITHVAQTYEITVIEKKRSGTGKLIIYNMRTGQKVGSASYSTINEAEEKAKRAEVLLTQIVNYQIGSRIDKDVLVDPRQTRKGHWRLQG